MTDDRIMLGYTHWESIIIMYIHIYIYKWLVSIIDTAISLHVSWLTNIASWLTNAQGIRHCRNRMAVHGMLPEKQFWCRLKCYWDIFYMYIYIYTYAYIYIHIHIHILYVIYIWYIYIYICILLNAIQNAWPTTLLAIYRSMELISEVWRVI